MALAGIDTAAMSEPFVQILEGTLRALPGLVAALVILLVGYIIGAIVGHVVEKILERTNVLKIAIKKANLRKEVGTWNLNEFFGLITKWYIFVVFLNPAAQVVQLTTLADFFSDAALWIPNIILAVVIALAGYVLAEYIEEKILEIKSKKKSLLASSAKFLTLVFVVIMALKQVGVAVDVAENAFLIVLAGIMLSMSIAFGFALRDDAKKLLKEIQKKL